MMPEAMLALCEHEDIGKRKKSQHLRREGKGETSMLPDACSGTDASNTQVRLLVMQGKKSPYCLIHHQSDFSLLLLLASKHFHQIRCLLHSLEMNVKSAHPCLLHFPAVLIMSPSHPRAAWNWILIRIAWRSFKAWR